MKKGFMFLLWSASFLADAQVMFQKIYKDTADGAYSVNQTIDGGYIIAGGSFTTNVGLGLRDIYLVKTDSNGDSLWTQRLGGASSDDGYFAQQTSDGGYIVTGGTFSFGAGNWDYYLIKINTNGDLLWSKTYGSAYGEIAYSVQQTFDNGYIVVGDGYNNSGSPDIFLVKTDSIGDTLWTKNYDQTGYQPQGFSVQQTSDSGYIIAGDLYNGFDKIDLIKIDDLGNIIWSKGISGSNDNYATAVKQTFDGGYIIAATGQGFGLGHYDAYLIKTDSIANIEWSEAIGGGWNDDVNAVQQTSDSGFIFSGFTNSVGAGGQGVFLIKTNSGGDTLWTRTYGGTSDDESFSVQQTSDGGYVVAGYTSSYGSDLQDMYLIKTDANGNSGCNEVNPPFLVVIPNAQIVNITTVISHIGITVTNPQTISQRAGKPETLCYVMGINQSTPNALSLSIFPNPTNSLLEIKTTLEIEDIDLFNLLGEKVPAPVDYTLMTVDCQRLPPGIYILQASGEGKVWREKVIKE